MSGNGGVIPSIFGGSGGPVPLTDILSIGNSAGLFQINMNSNRIINIAIPIFPTDAANKQYVDTVTSFLSGLVLPQTGTPSTPALGHNVLYFKSNNKLYYLDSDGNEFPVRAGSANIEYRTLLTLGASGSDTGGYVRNLYTLVSPYQVGDSTLEVYRNGVRQAANLDYIELDSTHVEFLSDIDVPDEILLRWLVSISSAAAITTETPTPIPNGIIQIFNTSRSFRTGSLQIYYNGARQRVGIGNDYVESGSNQFTLSFAPSADSVLVVTYELGIGSSGQMVWGEDCSTQIVSGGETYFTTISEFAPGTLRVYYNGLRLNYGDDYLENGSNALTMSYSTSAGSTLIVDYSTEIEDTNANRIFAASDIEITTSSRGVIFRSPTGYRYRLTVNDLGTVTTIQL